MKFSIAASGKAATEVYATITFLNNVGKNSVPRMHQIFYLAEFWENLLENLPLYDVHPGVKLSLCLVQKQTLPIILRSIWRDITLDKLLYLFPEEIIKTNREGKKMGFIRPPFRKEWERFALYSSFIRTIHRPSTPGIKVSNILYYFSTFRPTQEPLFPNLERLSWYINVNSSIDLTEARFMGPLITSSLNSFVFTLDLNEDLSYSHPDELSVEEALSIPFWCLIHVGARLREFQFPFLHGINFGMTYHSACFSFLEACQSLVLLSIVPSKQLMHLLSGFQFLRTLDLNIPQNGQIWIRDGNCCRPATLSLDPFPVLEALTIRVWALLDATNFLAGLRCFPRILLYLDAYLTPTPNQLKSFFEVIIHPTTNADLKHVILCSSSTIPQLEDNKISILKMISPILSLRELIEVEIDFKYKFIIVDEDIPILVHCWPGLTSLTLQPHSQSSFDHDTEDGSQDTYITLKGLSSLVSCKNLMQLDMTVDIKKAPSKEDWIVPMSTDCSLRYWGVQSSRIRGPWQKEVIQFLRHHFPNLMNIRYDGANVADRTIWEEVNEGLEAEDENYSDVSLEDFEWS